MSAPAIDFAAGRRALRQRPAAAEAAAEIATQLFRVEHAAGELGLEVSALFATMIRARREAGVASTVGHELIAQADAIQRVAVDTMLRLKGLHEDSARVAEQLGVRADFGATKPPKDPQSTQMDPFEGA